MNILRLALKDLRQQRAFFFVLLLLQVAGSVILSFQLPKMVPPQVGVSILQLFGWGAGFVFCYRTIVSDEKNRAFFFLKTLPITDTEIALGKFSSNLILVSANFLAIIAYYSATRLVLEPGRVLDLSFGATLLLFSTQVLNSFAFLATALLFDSEKAVWVPFPLIWISVTVLANIGRVTRALHVERAWDFLVEHPLLLAAAVLAASAGLMLVTVTMFKRRRRFG
jgi:hypothetical protein